MVGALKCSPHLHREYIGFAQGLHKQITHLQHTSQFLPSSPFIHQQSQQQPGTPTHPGTKTIPQKRESTFWLISMNFPLYNPC